MKYKGRIVSSIVANVSSTIASAVWSLQDEMQGIFGSKWPTPIAPPLYTFTDATIAPTIASGIYGKTGPTLAQIVAATTSTGDVSWKNNTTYYNVTSGIISWMVPVTGNYSFEIWGARGGNGASNNYLGGYGARMKGTFALNGGDIIKILIGQMGGASYGGGGGGTFVATSANVPLIVAGGGNTTSPWSSTLSHAPTTTSGLPGSGMSNGGTNGGGGGGGSNNGTSDGGAGFTGNGLQAGAYNGVPPQSFINGGAGNTNGCNNSIGGFGGGSASDGCQYGQSGPGGGYSGGGAGSTSSGYGGAGGSYNNGTNQSNDAGSTGTATLSDNGKVIITKL